MNDATEESHYAAVICNGDSIPGQEGCGQVLLSESEYTRQTNKPDSLWTCPRCGSTAEFDDDYFDERHPDEPPELTLRDAAHKAVTDFVNSRKCQTDADVCVALSALGTMAAAALDLVLHGKREKLS